MLALALCDVRPGNWVCDTCGLLVVNRQVSGVAWWFWLLVSNEVIRSRFELLELSLARVGYPNYMVTNLELESLAEVCNDVFDCVIVDAPCTGQSMIARGKLSLAAYPSVKLNTARATATDRPSGSGIG